jgi:glucosyl-dolichyl phosphate glucuronosyltransferase
MPVADIVVVVDHNAELLARAQRELSGVIVVANTDSRGASGARNAGAAVSNYEVVAFIDDDMLVHPAWLETLLSHFSIRNVIGVGGKSEPLWPTARPRWLAPELDWAVGASYRGMPEVSEPVRNVWSGNMAVRREIFEEISGFRDGFGKIGHRSNPEDTDLCLRATAASSGGTWIYEPAAIASHRIPHEYTTLRFILTRCFTQGKGKANLATMNGMGRSTSTERWYVRRVLPRGIVRGLREAAHGDICGVCRSLVITACLFMALAGFAFDRAAAMVGISGIDRNFKSSRTGGVRASKRRKDSPKEELLGSSASSPDLPTRRPVASAHGDDMVLRSPTVLADATKTESAESLNRANVTGRNRRKRIVGLRED